MSEQISRSAPIKIERLTQFKGTDLSDICDATEATLNEDSFSFTISFERENSMLRDKLESYWRGVLLVPQRELFVGRLDGVIAAAIQLIKPGVNNLHTAFCGYIENHFVAPWARGHGLAKLLLKAAENSAKEHNLSLLRLSVRAMQESAIKLYENNEYRRWGTLDKYEQINGKMLSGHFYYKDLK